MNTIVTVVYFMIVIVIAVVQSRGDSMVEGSVWWRGAFGGGRRNPEGVHIAALTRWRYLIALGGPCVVRLGGLGIVLGRWLMAFLQGIKGLGGVHAV